MSWWDEQPAPPAAGPAPAPAGPAPGAPTAQVTNGTVGTQSYPLSAVSGTGFMAPWTASFNAPTAGDMATKDPGYQFRMQEAQKAIERGSAARGTLLSGRAEKELGRYMQDYASNEYDKVYGRALNEYNTAYNVFNNNLSRQWSTLGTLSNSGQNAANAVGQFGSSYGNQASDLITGAGNAQAAGQVGSGNAWNQALGGIGNNVSQWLALSKLIPQLGQQQGPQQPVFGNGLPMPSQQSGGMMPPTPSYAYDPGMADGMIGGIGG